MGACPPPDACFPGVTCTGHEFGICQNWFLVWALLLSSRLTFGTSISLILNTGPYLPTKVFGVSVELVHKIVSYKLLTSVHEGLFQGIPASFLCVLAGRASWLCPPEPMRQMSGVCSAVCVGRLTYLDPAVRCSPKHPGGAEARRGAGQEGGGSPAPPLMSEPDRSVSQVPLSRKKGSLVLRHQAHNLLPKRRLSAGYRAPGFQCLLQ